MLESFGARLRAQRVRQGITLASVTDQTKIKQSLLEGLERDDVSHWPAGLFRRAYVRAYAQAIGLDPEVVVREFAQLYPDPSEEVSLSKIVDTADRDRTSAPPTRFGFLLRSAIRSIPGRSRAAGEQAHTEAFSRIVDETPSMAAPPHAVAEEHEVVAAYALLEEPALLIDEEPGAPLDATPSSHDEHDARTPAAGAPPFDLAALANLCTAFGRAATPDDLVGLLGNAARLLEASGAIVWVWDYASCRLRAELAYGYSERVLAQIPSLEREAPNATAAAFRLEQPCTVDGRHGTSGALVVPIMTSAGCAGVLAMELRHGTPADWAPALATIVASQLSRWLEPEIEAQTADRLLA